MLGNLIKYCAMNKLSYEVEKRYGRDAAMDVVIGARYVLSIIEKDRGVNIDRRKPKDKFNK